MSLELFVNQMVEMESLVPRELKGKKVAQPTFTREVVTVVGLKTTAARFLPVSHEGHSNETYVDKVDVLGKQRAEFIARKLKGIERRAHMALFRELAARTNGSDEWKSFFEGHFGTPCIIPDGLCIACWNCGLFGGLDAAGQRATFSRARYFDTYSIEETLECVSMLESEEGMGIGNQVYEDMVADKEGKPRGRGAETYHLYEYVKAGTHFPFITLIESPTLLDVVGYLHAVRRADAHGYGKYSANHGKFDTQFLAVATGYPRFSVLNMLEWAEAGDLEAKFANGEVQFDALGEAVMLTGDEIDALADKLQGAFDEYVAALG
ncbi:MAG TPA: type I-D CRISPR-associated protein Csc2 [Chloroflexi bacterium]|nr:type I-D CRISPR-associated protein Csc2 [Chloroflexota bacterium]